jgi:hypothetical protein
MHDPTHSNASIATVSSLIDHVEMLPKQVKDKILGILNQGQSLVVIEEDAVVVRTVSRCTGC